MEGTQQKAPPTPNPNEPDLSLPPIDSVASMAAGQPDRLSPMARRFAMGSFIYQVDAQGAWTLKTTRRIFYEYGVNDQSTSAATYQNAGVNASAGAENVYSITNAGRAGALVIGNPGIVLGFGFVVMNHARINASPAGVVTDTDWAFGANAANYAPPGGGNIGDWESQKVAELFAGALHCSAFQLLPLDANSSCPLVLGVPQLMPAGIGMVDAGLPGIGDRKPVVRYRLRRPVIVPPEVQGTASSANRFYLNVDYPITTVESVYNSPPRPATTGLAIDVYLVVDVAKLDADYDYQSGKITAIRGYATDYDANLVACYQNMV